MLNVFPLERLSKSWGSNFHARLKANRVVNTELLVWYWDIGRANLDRQDAQGWGTKVVERLAADLRAEFPEMRGFSRSNLHYMRTVAGS